MNKKFPINKIFFSILLITQGVKAEELFFNPNFLSDKDNKIDLSTYERRLQPPGNYETDIYVNNEFSKKANIKFISNTDKNEIEGSNLGLYPCVDIEFIKGLGVSVPDTLENTNDNCIIISKINDNTTVQFDFLKQRLNLNFPQILIKNDYDSVESSKLWDHGINAGLVNYSLNSNINDYNESYFLGLETGFNLGNWRFRNNSSYIYNKNKENNSTYKKWNTNSSYFERAFPEVRGNLIVGEGFSSNTIFDSVGFKGVKLSSANEMLPTRLQGFAPDISGFAQTSAKVTIRQNGRLIYQTFVSPGPFEISDLYSTGSSGNLEMTIEESNGSTLVKQIPYSTVPILQRPKQLTYEFTGGIFNSGNDTQNSPFFMQGTAIYGLNNNLTVYGGLQVSKNYKSLMAGIGGNLGDFGALSFDITHANSMLSDKSNHQGQALRLLYAKTLNSYGTTLKLVGYKYATKGFYTLSDTTYKKNSGYNYIDDSSLNNIDDDIQNAYSYYNLNNNKKGRYQFNLSQNLKNLGSLNASLDIQNYWNTDQETKNISIGYANTWNKINYNLSYNHSTTLGFKEKEKLFLLSLNIPLDGIFRKYNQRYNSAYINSTLTHSKSYGDTQRVGVSGTLLDDRNLSYNLNYSARESNKDFYNANVNYRGGNGNIGFGYSNIDNNFSLSMNGSAIVHKEGITLGQELGGTTILVKAHKASNVPIKNKTGVVTNKQGYAIVPSAEPYRINQIALDIEHLDNKVEIPNNIKTAIPTKGAIVFKEFETKLGFISLVTLSENEQPIPFGANVIETSSNAQGIVGEEGAVYLTGLPPKGTLEIQKGYDQQNSNCYSNYEIPKQDYDKNIILLNLQCTPTQYKINGK
jgi:outer membrane usher protein